MEYGKFPIPVLSIMSQYEAEQALAGPLRSLNVAG